MTTRHIHIKGLVQGVGFRPYVYSIATSLGLKGSVNNSDNGVHILITGDDNLINQFCHQLISHPPRHAVITTHEIIQIPLQQFDHFSIAESESTITPDLMITPDLGMCEECRQELFHAKNRRYQYPFITCIHCGPRYSIIQQLPYDRIHTTMEQFDQCRPCKTEYHNPLNRRYYSQTNSCTDCGITMQLFSKDGNCRISNQEEIIDKVVATLSAGQIVAIKGIGGFLLMCDALNTAAISNLRFRKKRARKPLALLYANIELLEKDAVLSTTEKNMLQDSKSPIVLCRVKENMHHPLPISALAPGLNRIGAMLPNAPLLALIANTFAQPLVATSANISGCPILFDNEEALKELGNIADLILIHDRDIVTPQDDSVIQFSSKHQLPILLRRSRGWAPGFYPYTLALGDEKILATGAELKGSFSIVNKHRCYVSQYLGDQGVYEAQKSYKHTLNHLAGLLHFEPTIILADKHPAYEVGKYAEVLADSTEAALLKIQHHEAHFAAVLGENDLLEETTPILGIIWDGTGYGNDGNIWGGECFTFHQNEFERIAHLDYFPTLMGDKMSREPRLSALAICSKIPSALAIIQKQFTAEEWKIYQGLLQNKSGVIQTSSMGRLLDGIASLLGITSLSSYEGEAAMLLQCAAEKADKKDHYFYPIAFNNGIVRWQQMIVQIADDLRSGFSIERIAAAVHRSLALLIISLAENTGISSIALSGGVMQNTFLMDMIIDFAGERHSLFFHTQLSPNDECISFGQLAWYASQQTSISKSRKKQHETVLLSAS